MKNKTITKKLNQRLVDLLTEQEIYKNLLRGDILYFAIYDVKNKKWKQIKMEIYEKQN